MTAKSEHLAEARHAFSRRYAPPVDCSPYSKGDFEVELDRLIYAAFAVAQEPFVREFEMFKKAAIEKAFHTPSDIAL